MSRAAVPVIAAMLLASLASAFRHPSIIRPSSILSKRSLASFSSIGVNPIEAQSPTAINANTKPSHFKNFVTAAVEDDLLKGKNGGRVVTRFPPEPNGYLHLGHAKSINVNFAVAKHYNGVTNMRFDDTNPAKEDMEYILAILDDVRWIVTGDKNCEPPPWDGKIRHASDYFQAIYDSAEYLIQKDLAYVDDLSQEQIRQHRGTLTEPGKHSPFRNRSIEENLRLFREMKAGKFPDGHCVLRAKIDMASPNVNMRDPTLFRIKKESHPITKNEWCIYPMYDFAHAISDAMEGITHSLCTLEFADHRPLYDWTVDNLLPSGILPFQKEGWRPHQYEFSRLNVQYTVLSKRKLIQLVRDKHVNGWDDPRMPTISGLRRRGYPAEAIRLFCDRVGISKSENNIDIAVLEECVREVLDESAPRVMAVLHPLKVTITNWPENETEVLEADCHPKRAELGKRKMSFTKELFIDREDFFDTGPNGEIKPPKGYKRLVPGGNVRLKFAFVINCDEVVRNENGDVVELRCSCDTATLGGVTPAGSKKAKGIIQWLSSKDAVPSEVRLYDRLFTQPSPGSTQPDGDFLKDINPDSLQIIEGALVGKELEDCPIGSTFQFERVGYFCKDEDSQSKAKPIFNRIVTLKDTWTSNSK